MSSLNKKDMIKEYVFSSKENFEIANDISSNWWNIQNDMVLEIGEKIAIFLRSKNISYNIEPSNLYASKQYINVHLSHNDLIQLGFDNYYKNMTVEARLLGGNKEEINNILSLNGYNKNGNGYIKKVNKYSFQNVSTISDFYDLYVSAIKEKNNEEEGLFEQLVKEIEKSVGDIIFITEEYDRLIK